MMKFTLVLRRTFEPPDDVIQIRNVKKIHQSHKRAQCNVPVMSDPVHAGDRKSKTPEQVVMRKSFFPSSSGKKV